MRERPAWGAWLGRQAGVQEEELILSSELYVSPAPLLVGECGIVYKLGGGGGPGSCRPWPRCRTEKGVDAPLPPWFPLYQCRRAFAAAACAGTPLALALRELQASS